MQCRPARLSMHLILDITTSFISMHLSSMQYTIQFPHQKTVARMRKKTFFSDPQIGHAGGMHPTTFITCSSRWWVTACIAP